MLRMMELHDLLGDVGLERIVCVRERRELVLVCRLRCQYRRSDQVFDLNTYEMRTYGHDAFVIVFVGRVVVVRERDGGLGSDADGIIYSQGVYLMSNADITNPSHGATAASNKTLIKIQALCFI